MTNREPVDILAEQFLCRRRNGEDVTWRTYAEQFPEHADEIREVFPALVMVEELVPDDTEPESTPQLKAPQQVGDYRILRKVGSGGMGVVYEAEQVSLGRRVALKVLLPHASRDTAAMQRFRIEARAAAQLQHPNIVPVFEVGEEDGAAYYAMQFIQGHSLEQVKRELRRLRREPQQAPSVENGEGDVASSLWHGSWQPRESLSENQRDSEDTGGDLRSEPVAQSGDRPQQGDQPRSESNPSDGSSPAETRVEESSALADTEVGAADSSSTISAISNLSGGSIDQTGAQKYFRSVARLGIHVAEALGYAHRQSVVHRDVKPSNLLLDANGGVWLTDFGLAKVGGKNLTRSGDVVGTVRYMAPERFKGWSDPRSDIYSLGMTLYEMLALQPAFDSSDRVSLVNEIINEQASPLRKVDRQIPHDLETIVSKAIDKEPSRRYQQAEEVADDLRRFLRNEPILARRVTSRERLWRWSKRNPVVAALMASVFLLMMLLSIGSSATAWRSIAQAEAQNRVLYARDMQAAATAIEQGDHPRAEHILRKWMKDHPDQRHFEWFYLWNKCHTGAARRTLRHRVDAKAAAYSEDGTLLAVSTWDSTVRLFDARNGQLVRTLQSASPNVSNLLRQPESNVLVAGDRGGHVTFWDFATGKQLEELTLPLPPDRNQVYSVDVLPDRQLVAVGAGRAGAVELAELPATVQIWDRQDGKWTQLEGFSGAPRVRFSVDGRFLFTGCHQGSIKVWNTDTWAVVEEHDVSLGGITRMTLSPDGTLLATGAAHRNGRAFDSQIVVWKVDTWEPQFTTQLPADMVFPLTFSPDGKMLAAGMQNGVVHLIDWRAGATHTMPSAHMGEVYGVTFSRDGRHLVTCGGDNNARVWPVSQLISPPTADVAFLQHAEFIVGAAFVDSGATACTVDTGGNVVVWDAATGMVHQQVQVKLPGSSAAILAVSPNHRWLAVKCGHWPVADSPGLLEVFELPSLKRKTTLRLEHGCFTVPDAFSHDSKRIAMLCKHFVVVAETKTGKIVGELGPFEEWVKVVTFSPDGRLLACCTETGDTHVYEANSLKPVQSIKTDEDFTHAMAFSPDGKLLATGGSDSIAKLWDARTFKPVGQCNPCRDFIVHLAFSPDSQRILTTSKDGKVRIWDPRSGEELLELTVSNWWLPNGQFSQDGRSLLAATGRTAIVFRAADPDALEQLQIEYLPHLGCD